MGYLDEERGEENEEFLEDEDEMRELEVDDNGRIRRGPRIRPEDDFEGDEPEESEDEVNPYSEGDD